MVFCLSTVIPLSWDILVDWEILVVNFIFENNLTISSPVLKMRIRGGLQPKRFNSIDMDKGFSAIVQQKFDINWPNQFGDNMWT